MKRLLALFALLLVGAATPQLLVHVQPQQGVIADYEHTTGEPADWQRGEWAVQLLDESGLVVSEAPFDPTVRTGGAPALLEDVYVRVFRAPSGVRLRLLDGAGAVRDSVSVVGACGDGVCAASERSFCEEDCIAPETTDAAVRNLSAPPAPEAGLERWRAFVIGAAVLLIVVLVLVLVHLNRKRDNPVEMGYEGY